jgi:UDP-N-acetylmuramoyl-tripeptide--D-alanyl-D-alanine ligase
MGAGKPGDIAYLAEIARPDVVLVTNALPAHLERLGSLEEVARTKGAIYEALPAQGVAVLNIDDAFAPAWAERIGARRTIRVSARGAAEADVRASAVSLASGCATFTLVLAGAELRVRLRIPGVQQVANAVAAAGVALALGIDVACVPAGLESLEPGAGRMRPRPARGGALVIDDTYNANPGSVRAAIDTLATFPGTRVLVLGNMAELGAEAAELHAAAGAYAHERGIERLLATGVHAKAVASAFGAGGCAYANREALAEACAGLDAPDVVMLVKGSRSAGMEAVVAALVDAVPGLSRAEAH